MKLRRIEIKDFRKLGHVVVDGLGDGLNVVVGHNEAGKSTLLAALRTALFERHRLGGKVAEDMLPYGQAVRPEIWLDFEAEGASYRLHKAFVQKPEAELIGDGQRWTGDAVEERMAQMFGFTPPGRGESKPDQHHGVFGLLWVEQGTAHRALGVGAGRDHLAAALEREVGQVTGGERGRALLAAAEARRAEFWDKRDNPRGSYRLLMSELAEAKERFAGLEAQLRSHEDKVARLGAVDEILARHAASGAQAQAARALEAAHKAVAAIGTLESAAQRAGEGVLHARLKAEAVRARVSERGRLRDGIAKAVAGLGQAESDAGEGDAVVARCVTQAEQLAGQTKEAQTAEREAGALLQRLERAMRDAQAREALDRLAGQLEAARRAGAAQRKALAEAEAERLTDKDVAALQKLDEAVRQHRLRLDAAGVRLKLVPEAGQAARIEGQAEAVARELTVSADAVLWLEGFGRIEIHPGGGIAPLRAALEAAERDLAQALGRLGQPSLAAAQAALARQAECRARAEQEGRTLAALAPKGLDALEADWARYQAQLDRAQGDAEPVDAQAVVAARQAAEAARGLAETLRGAEAEARTALERARVDLAVRTERVTQAKALVERLRGELDRALLAEPDAVLEAMAGETDAALAAAAAGAVAAKAALEAADPEAARLEAKRAEAAEAALREDIERLSRERRDLDIELRTMGRDGLGEARDALEGEIAYMERRLAQMTLEAQGARLLHEALVAAQRESRDRWLAPVRQRSAPYLRLVQPDSAIVLNEQTLELDQVVRGGVPEPFSGLSVGAREQIAVITRLALADILREAGRASCIVLDDALVNTDEARLERMHLVLHKAAENQQILILTCRERDFLQLGAPIRRM